MTEYKYFSLPSPVEGIFTRILQLHPGKGEDPIQVSLISYEVKDVVDGKAQPMYDALSYTWGSSPKRHAVYCDDQVIWVTTNAFDALTRLRNELEDQQLWIDAICINQSDVDERKSHIRFMRLIYRFARRVVVWLGRADETTETAFKMLKNIAEIHCRDIGEIATPKEFTNDDWRELQSFGYTTRDWEALNGFFARPWFTRVWVAQEVSVTRTEDDAILLLCGNREIAWNTAARAALWIVNGGRIPYTGGYDIFPAVMLHDWKLKLATGESFSMVRAMEDTRPFKVTLDHDRVYGILGLMSYGAFPDEVEVDYSIPVETLYTRFAKVLIEDERSLDVLTCVGNVNCKGNYKVPFWVPDWTAQCYTVPTGSPHNDAAYCASADIPYYLPDPSIDLDSEILLVDAIFVDEVFQVGTTSPVMSSGLELSGQEQELIDIYHFNIWPRDTYFFGENPTDAFWRTLIADRDARLQQVDKQYRYHFIGFWIQLIGRRYPAAADELDNLFLRREIDGKLDLLPTRTHETFAETPSTTPSEGEEQEINKDALVAAYREAFQPLLSPGNQFSDPVRFMTAMLGGMSGRRFFTTKQGAIGTGPPSIRSGDKVAILAGGRVPFLLREAPIKGTEAQNAQKEPEYWSIVNDTILRFKIERNGDTDPASERIGFSDYDDERPVKPMEDIIRDCSASTFRPSDWDFVGDCYVHGLMRGEWFKVHPDKVFRTIRLH